MNRRDLMMVGASTAIAHGVTTVMGCGAQSDAAATTTPLAVTGDDAALRADVISSTSECIQAGEICLAQCLRLLGAGDTSMAECSKNVSQMLAVCAAMTTLAAADATHLRALAEVCIAVCTDCEASCRPHAGHHPECAACGESCRRCADACRALVA